MAQRRIPNLIIENAEIRFRNFTGAQGQYNRKGDRNFCVLIDPAVAPAMEEDGWNIKFLKPRIDKETGQQVDPDEVPRPYIQVSVNFDNRPPNIFMISSRGRTRLGEDEVMVLDFAELKSVDLTINPYPWEVDGKRGIKAYLKSLYATIEEDALDLKYSDVPDSGQAAMAMRDGFTGEQNPPWN